MEQFKLKYFLLSLLSGIFFAISFQKFNLFCFTWFAFVPVLYCIFNSNVKNSFLYGFITGFTYSSISLFWLFIFLNNNLNSYISSFFVSVLLWTYLSLYFSLWAALIAFVKQYFKKCFYLILFVASSWVFLEFIRTYLLTGFPWNIAGYSQASFFPIIQIADITGVYGVSFLILIINTIIYIAFFNNKNFSFISNLKIYDNKKFSIIFYMVLLSVVLCYGFFKFNKFNTIYGDEISVGVLQPNIDQYKKWDERYKQEIIKELDENIKYFKDKVEIIVYPESVLPGYLQIDDDIKKLVERNLKTANLQLIGANSIDIENDKIYNSVFAIDKDGNIDLHSKNHLVIFGEYIPFRSVLSKFFGILNSLGDFSKSNVMNVFKYDKIFIGSTICSENFFPSFTRMLVKNGANLLTNHTNDAWFGNSAAPYQHFVMNIFRAVETRKNIVVCANSGISAVINCAGNAVKKTNIYEQANFITTVYYNNYKSLYVVIGDFFAYLCSIFTIICFCGFIIRRGFYVGRIK